MKFGYSDDQSEGFMSPSVDELLCQQLISSRRKHTPSRTRVQTRQDSEHWFLMKKNVSHDRMSSIES